MNAMKCDVPHSNQAIAVSLAIAADVVIGSVLPAYQNCGKWKRVTAEDLEKPREVTSHNSVY